MLLGGRIDSDRQQQQASQVANRQMTPRPRRSVDRIRAVPAGAVLGVAIATAMTLGLLAAAQDVALAKQAARTEHASPQRSQPQRGKAAQAAPHERTPTPVAAQQAAPHERVPTPVAARTAPHELVPLPLPAPVHQVPQQELVKQLPAEQPPVKMEATKQALAKQEPSKQEPSEQELVKQEPAKPDAAEPEAAKPPEPEAALVDLAPSGTEGDSIASHLLPSAAPGPDPGMDEVNQYLWGVYVRTARKHDNSGDFTWKDVAAAAHLGMTLGDYVIVGMDADFRELLYRAGLAMDAAGMHWTILSAFRDDYRQGLATGYKARIGDSLHGGSMTTGGYGHGCAVDIADADGKLSVPLWHWLDVNSAQVGLERPLPGIDPAHIQARGPWHAVAAELRRQRLAKDMPSEDAPADTELVDLTTQAPTDTDMMCVGLHHHRIGEQQASMPPSDAANFDAARAHVPLPPPAPGRASPHVDRHTRAASSRTAVRTGSASATDGSPAHGKLLGRSLSHHALRSVSPASAT
jgi:hypothetical protein